MIIRQKIGKMSQMSAATTIFAITFLLFVGITLVVPSVPPAQLLFESLSIPQTTSFVWGISLASLMNGVINGLFWALIASAVSGVARYSRELRPLPPMPVAPHLETPPPEAILVDDRVSKIPPSLTVPLTPLEPLIVSSIAVQTVTVRTAPLGPEIDVETIEGIGPVCGGLLKNAGIATVNDLLRVGATERGRRRLANEVGVTYATMLRWIYRGDLLRVKGIGGKYATLLESAGVNSVTDLSTKNPYHLCETLKAVNRERAPVKRVPPSKTIEIWVRQAKNLEPILTE